MTLGELGLFGIGALVIAGVIVWLRRRQAMKYDPRYWTDEPPGETCEDGVDKASGPYCHLCDHPNPPDTYFCRSCGQKIA